MSTTQTYKNAFDALRDNHQLFPSNLRVSAETGAQGEVNISFTPTMPTGPKTNKITNEKVETLAHTIHCVFYDAPPRHMKEETGVSVNGATISFEGRGIQLLDEAIVDASTLKQFAEDIKSKQSEIKR